MNKFEKNQIKQALRRCFGLAEALQSEDILTYNEAVIKLARQSGLRYQFVLDNLDNVKKIVKTELQPA